MTDPRTIRIANWDGEVYAAVEVPCHGVRGVWAITPYVHHVGSEPAISLSRYVVTHVPSGAQACNSATKEQAARLLEMLFMKFPNAWSHAAFGKLPVGRNPRFDEVSDVVAEWSKTLKVVAADVGAAE